MEFCLFVMAWNWDFSWVRPFLYVVCLFDNATTISFREICTLFFFLTLLIVKCFYFKAEMMQTVRATHIKLNNS